MSRSPWFDAGNIECHFQFSEACILLADVIDKVEKMAAEEVYLVDHRVLIDQSIKRELRKLARDLIILRSNYRELINRLVGCNPRKLFDTLIRVAPQVQKFEEDILSLVYSVEDSTSSFICTRETLKKNTWKQKWPKTMVRDIFVVFFNILTNESVLRNEMKKGRLIGRSQKCLSSLLYEIKEANNSLDDTYTSDSEAVGFEQEEGSLFEEIFRGQQSYISVLGRAGCGKTTVARKVYKEIVAARDFEMCVWVTVSPHDNIRDVCAAILSKTESTRADLSEFDCLRSRPSESLFESVSKKLGGGKFITVLDDVHYIWSDIESEMERLFPIIPGLGSKVVFITHDARVAKRTKVIELNGLSDKGSWELFCHTIRNTQIYAEEEILTMDILGEISTGLPLRVIALANLFITVERSHLILLQRLPDSGRFEIHSRVVSLKGLNFLYHILAPTIRLCYLYMMLFPRAFPIPIRRLIRLWIAEGLVIKSDIPDLNTLEDVALNYLEQLQTRQMVQVTEKDGRPKTCQIPEGIHEFFCEKAKHIGIFHIHNELDTISRPPKFNVGRLAGHVDIKYYPTSDPYIQHLHSYVSFDTRKRDTPTQKQIGVFLDQLTAKRGFGLLRVLDLEGVYKPLLTAGTLGKLSLLTYLGLRWTLLDSLPDSVGGLHYLEALDVKHTNITSLPSSIWKAKNLRHLYMNQVYFDMSNKRSFTARLTKLQTLWGLSIGSNSLVVNWLSQLIELRKLGLTYHPTTAQAIANWVAKLTNLQSLRLRSIDEFGEPSDLKLPNMSKLDNLSDLYLVGVLQVPNSVKDHEFQFPSNLKILTLTGSKLVGNDSLLRMLGTLDKLNTLRFYGHSYWGDELIFYNNEFPKLVVLKLWMLEKLNKLELQEGALSSLEEIDIRLCQNLKNLNGLEQRSHTLRMITLTNMPADFVQNVTRAVDQNVAVEVKELNFSSV